MPHPLEVDVRPVRARDSPRKRRYGMSFIQMTSSVYPWFHASRSIGNVIIGTVDRLIDGAIAGLIFALLYNAVTNIPRQAGSHQQV